jgi:hypothetical protein
VALRETFKDYRLPAGSGDDAAAPFKER